MTRTKVEKLFGVSVILVFAEHPAKESDLTQNEIGCLRQFGSKSRREFWLTGRAALKNLLSHFNEKRDTAALSFPHPRFSLTHSRGMAVAVGVKRETLKGIGVDLEMKRPIRLEATRFFLSAQERNWIARLGKDEQEENLLRLWTVKEALFKANPRNNGTRMTDYILQDPQAEQGKGFFKGDSSLRMGYRSFPIENSLENGSLSLAIARA